jgi:phosphate transport system substrate-binding protein
MEVSTNENSEYFKPYQAYIAQKIYPLWREVYIISKEAYTGLGTGLTAFIASERGQRIVLKFGLVPATMPVRLVELINEEITY